MTSRLIEIASLAAGGDGVARDDGLVIFTPRTAPGDVVEAEVRVQGRVGRGRLRRLVRPGASRVEPRCAHFAAPDRCGGCQWQQVDLAVQREAKVHLVRDAFQRIARREVELPDITAGSPWRYRRTLTLAIRRQGDRTWAGLRAFDDPEAVFALDDCEITDAAVIETWKQVLAQARYLPPVDRLRGTVRVIDGDPVLVLEGGVDWPMVERFLGAVPRLAAVWWQPHGKRRRLVADRRSASRPGASFAQVNAEVATMLQRHLLERARSFAPRTVIDGYSGAGDTAAALAADGAVVTAVELDEEASAHAATRLAAPSRAIAAKVEDVVAGLLPADLVVLNPPRAGVDARVAAILDRASPAPRAILYVSCDPASLARDVARLPAWRIAGLHCFDMFPQTSHVETVCELVPVAA